MNTIQKSFGLLSLCACAVVPVSLHAETVFDSVSGFGATQGENGWSYAYTHFSGQSDFRTNQVDLVYDLPNLQWKGGISGTPGVKITADEQNYLQGNAYFSLRYWTADQDYDSLTFTSSLTSDVSNVSGHVVYSTALGTQVKLMSHGLVNNFTTVSIDSADAADVTIAGSTAVSDGVIYNILAGDRIYFSMQNTGSTAGGSSDGNGLQPWTMQITAIPEPSAFALIGASLAFGVVMVRRQRR